VKHSIRDKVLALAGVYQAADLVQQVARKGIADGRDLETLMYSLYQTDPPHVEAVYRSVAGLRSGLRLIVTQLGSNPAQRDLEITRYVVSLLHLQRRLSHRPDTLALVAQGIEKARRQSEHFSITHDNVLANLASLYADTLSRIPPRIMVSGEPHLLANPDNANKIRAVLLAGIRSAVLWRQCGGSRWQIVFQRKALANEAQRLLAEEAQPQLH